MLLNYFNPLRVHCSWQNCLEQGLQLMDQDYLKNLHLTNNWIPGATNIFNAFSQPVSRVKYLLLGESPYPRLASANGYAFWDAAVTNLWSPTGMSTSVNRATSLRNFLKMLLLAAGLISSTTLTQEHISKINKNNLVQTSSELFNNLLNHNFLLLNASLVLSSAKVKQEVQIWQPFLQQVVLFLTKNNPKIKFILFGKLAQTTAQNFPTTKTPPLYSEHPYNYSFITNPEVLDFFRQFKLLETI